MLSRVQITSRLHLLLTYQLLTRRQRGNYEVLYCTFFGLKTAGQFSAHGQLQVQIWRSVTSTRSRSCPTIEKLPPCTLHSPIIIVITRVRLSSLSRRPVLAVVADRGANRCCPTSSSSSSSNRRSSLVPRIIEASIESLTSGPAIRSSLGARIRTHADADRRRNQVRFFHG